MEEISQELSLFGFLRGGLGRGGDDNYSAAFIADPSEKRGALLCRGGGAQASHLTELLGHWWVLGQKVSWIRGV